MPNDYVGKALESFKAAWILFEAECYDSCVSRCYYAMFQMAVAALTKFNIQPPKAREYKHAWVHAVVAQQLIRRRKLLPGALASALPRTLALRRIADYDEVSIGKKQAERVLRLADQFIRTLQGV
jgi:uncharacterized protein (UPF0332 family)